MHRLNTFIILILLNFSLGAQSVYPFVPETNDTLFFVIDYNPLYTEDNTTGYQHDFTSLFGPCLTQEVFIHSDESFTIEKYGSRAVYEKEGSYYTKKTFDGKDIYGTRNNIHIDYKDKFTDVGPFDYKAFETLVSEIEIRIPYNNLDINQKQIIGECKELLFQGKHTIRILPKGKHELLLPGIATLAHRIQLDETFIARSGIALLDNNGKRRLTNDQVASIFTQFKRKKYLYFSTEESKKLLEITLEDNRIEKIEYAADIFKSHLPNCDAIENNVYLFPNPTIGEVRLHFENYPAGDYILDIYNIIGKRLSSIDVSLDPGEKEAFLILPDLKKGTYIYSIKNDQGDRLVSRRLSIITF